MTEHGRADWLNLVMELQALAQTGLEYSRDPYDLERFERIREISTEMMCIRTGLPTEFVRDVFCNETGFQTPKLDTRAAVFKDGKILLVLETEANTWSLPGGWVDVDQSVRDNTVKEVKEEAGVDVVAERLIAVHDRNRHNDPPYAYGICKIFVLCRLLSGEFTPNHETSASRFFGLDELPQNLSVSKNTAEQIRLCFEAANAEHWDTIFD